MINSAHSDTPPTTPRKRSSDGFHDSISPVKSRM
jgi:hypothetical protein